MKWIVRTQCFLALFWSVILAFNIFFLINSTSMISGIIYSMSTCASLILVVSYIYGVRKCTRNVDSKDSKKKE